MEKPRAGTICWLVACAVALFAVSVRLGSRPSGDRDALGRSHDPPTVSHPKRRLGALSPPVQDRSGAIELLRARVVDGSGRPIVGALLRAGGFDVCSGEDGSFAIPSSTAALTIEHDRYFRREVDVRALANAAAPPDLVLVPGMRVGGRILDAGSRPVRGALITIARDLSGPRVATRSDDEGRWRSPLLEAGSALVFVSHRDFEPAERSILLASPGTTTTCDVRLTTGVPLTVRARDRSGARLADADVWVVVEVDGAPGADHYIGRTDDLGELHAHRPLGAARLRVRLAGHREAQTPLTPTDGHERQVVDIELARAPLLDAQAVDAVSGLPLRPMRVTLEARDGAGFRPVPHRGLLFESLASGRVRAGMPPQAGHYRLVVEAADGFFGVSDTIDFDGVTAPHAVLVRLERRARLSGIVVADGKPVTGATVDLLAAAAGAPVTFVDGVAVDGALALLYSTRSDSAGRFAFAGVPAAACRLAARHPETRYAEHFGQPIESSLLSGSGDVLIALERGGTLRGRLLTADGEPAVGHAVVLTSRASRPRVARTVDDGRFEFASLAPADDYFVTAGRDDSTAGTHTIGLAFGTTGPLCIDAGATADCTLRTTLAPAGALAGVVRRDGVAAAACRLRVVAARAGHLVAETRTDDDGRFLVRPLPAGEYRLLGVDVPFAAVATVRAGERAQVEVGAASLAWDAALVWSDSDRPVLSSARVELTAADAGGPRFDGSLETSDGRARFDGLWPGVYTLRIEGRDFVALERRLDLRENATTRVALDPARSVRLRLVDATGAALSGLAAITIESDERSVFSGTLRVDGEFELPPLPHGIYTVTVRLGDRSARYRVTIGAAEVAER